MLVDQIKYVVNAVERIVNAEGILEDRLHIAAVGFELAIGHIGDIFAVEDDMTRCQFDEAKDEIRQRRLAAAAFAGDRGDRSRRLVDRHD